MKLEFLKKPMEYLRPVLREERMIEETAEAIIPDSCPDAQEVLHCSGLAFLRGKDLSDGMLSVSAGVSAMALCQIEDRETPEVVEVYIPMSLKLENDALRGGQVCRVEVRLRRLDGHLVNPRKVMVRATVAVCVWVYDEAREEHLTETAAAGVQVLKKTAPIRCLNAMGEKNYTVEDSVRMTPEGTGGVLAGCQIKLRHTDARLTGTRAVLKGEAELSVLYLEENGRAKTASAQVPFSQYIDLGNGLETDELRLISILTGADVELGSDGGSLNVTLQINTTAEVWGKAEIEYLGDMYSLTGQVIPETEQRVYDSLVDRQMFAPVGHGLLEGVMGRPLFVTAISGEVTSQRSGEMVTLTLPVTAQVLYEGEEGQLRGAVCRVELTASTQAAENCRFEATGEDITAIGSSGAGVDVKVSGNLVVNTFGRTAFTEIVGGELQEEARSISGPGLIIRRPKTGESLWDMAKCYRTTTDAIAMANGLSGDAVPEKMLLIPRSR